jgi:hypothetical protein
LEGEVAVDAIYAGVVDVEDEVVEAVSLDGGVVGGEVGSAQVVPVGAADAVVDD